LKHRRYSKNTVVVRSDGDAGIRQDLIVEFYAR